MTHRPTLMEHQTEIMRAADEVYELLADVQIWPRLFPPTVHIERKQIEPDVEDIQIWASANDEVKTWRSRRELSPSSRTITFRQEQSQHPVASMGGTWIVDDVGDQTSHVRLLHDFTAVDDEPKYLDWITKAVDDNSRSELSALKTNAEASTEDSGLLLEFEDAIEVDAHPNLCFDFVNEAGLWQDRLGHVSDVRLEESQPGIQSLAMDTTAKDGSTHTTKSYRICFPKRRIVYKQTTLPPLMTVHNGEWTFDPTSEDSCQVVSKHTVLINPDKIRDILGDSSDVSAAREYIRDALGTNSRMTLEHAKAFAEEGSIYG